MKRQDCQINCLDCQSRCMSLFSSSSIQELEKLNSNKAVIRYKKGETIFKEGGLAHGLFFLCKGKVKIHQQGDDGKDQITRFAKQGDAIGYRTLMSDDKYMCSATPIEETMVCYLNKNVFFEMITNNTSLAFAMMKLLANDLKRAEHKITEFAQKPVRERMAEALLFLKDIYGYESNDTILNVVLSREEIAYLAGTVRETATKLLSEFKDDGIIELIGKQVRIIDHDLLRKRANISE